MRRNFPANSWLLRILFGFTLSTIGVLLATLSFAPSAPAPRSGPRLAMQKIDLEQLQRMRRHAPSSGNNIQVLNASVPALPANAPTFGHPIIAGIGGTGFEESIRIDPTLNVNGEHTI